MQEIKKLPYLEYDNDGNVVYSGKIYKEDNVSAYAPYEFLISKCQPIAQEEYWGFPTEVLGCGKEDFGEYVYISVCPSEPGGREYLKSDFIFPNYLTAEVREIYISNDIATTQYNILEDVLQDNNITLNDLVVPIGDSINKRVDAYLDIYFSDYQTIYLCAVGVYIYNDNIYLKISDYKDYSDGAPLITYIVKDEYQELFKNAMEQIPD